MATEEIFSNLCNLNSLSTDKTASLSARSPIKAQKTKFIVYACMTGSHKNLKARSNRGVV